MLRLIKTWMNIKTASSTIKKFLLMKEYTTNFYLYEMKKNPKKNDD